MKKIDKLVITSFIGPYALSFFIAEFVLVMQFLWKYIDEILGKGFSVLDLLELIFYFGVTQISMALPIAILLASVMVFGNLSERYELSSMKSAGVSLVRILRPAIILALLTAAVSLFASNYLKPQANYQFQKRIRIMKSQKPSLSIEEKIFNRDFSNFVIRVEEKDKNGVDIKDVFIYDHTNVDKSLIGLTRAKQGKMYNSPDGGQFIMELQDGHSYREMKRESKGNDKGKKYPFMRTQFQEWKKHFDLSQFDTEDNEISINRNMEDMLNTFQLIYALDSLKIKKIEQMDLIANQDKVAQEQLVKIETEKNKNNIETVKSKIKEEDINISNAIKKAVGKSKVKVKEIQNIVKPVINQLQTDTLSVYKQWHQTISKDDKNNLAIKAVQNSGRRRDLLRGSIANIKALEVKRERYTLRLHQPYAFATICLVFLFIGAPLGSIIRKGGYGYPLLVAILFYMLFIIMTIMGEKLVKSSKMDPVLAAWIAVLIVFPVSIWLTVKALHDGKFEKLHLPKFLNELIN